MKSDEAPLASAAARPTMRLAAFNDHAAVAALLEEAGLPVPGPEDSLVHMLAARTDGALVGCVGWEPYGRQALLRSLAVAGDHRGQGLGRALVKRLLAYLKHTGVIEVYLLTTDAAGFFAAAGFVAIDRSQVPAPVLESREFSMSCCRSAVCMRCRLGHPARIR